MDAFCYVNKICAERGDYEGGIVKDGVHGGCLIASIRFESQES